MTTKEIFQNMTAYWRGDVWKAACEIARQWQNSDAMFPLVPRLSQIEDRIKRLKEEEGLSSPDQRFIDFAVKTLQFYRDDPGCRCYLYRELETFDPKVEKEKGNIFIFDSTMDRDGRTCHYTVRCRKCRQVYEVDERWFNHTMWGWSPLRTNPFNFSYCDDFPSPDKTQRVVYEHTNEVQMGGPLRGYAYLETEDKERILIHRSCGGPPVWHTSGQMIALSVWTENFAQSLAYVDLTKMELTIFRGSFGVYHIRSFHGTKIGFGSYSDDVGERAVACVVKIGNQ